MCTAMNLTTKDHYFGRNLDIDRSYGEQVCVMPRRFPLEFRRMGKLDGHYAMIGMAMVAGETPLYFDAVNEKGLCMAGLNFPGNAVYHPERAGHDNVTPFEFIPWILSQCASIGEARKKLEKLNLVDIPFGPGLPLSPLHWIISGREGSLVVESMGDGLHVYENPTGVLTNNPPFPYHLMNLSNYQGLSAANPENTLSKNLELTRYCQGLGGLGLPGDLSSMSRFVRTVFHRENAVCGEDEHSSVSQFFHILGTVEMPRGSCMTEEGSWDITVYSSCVNADKGLYYYTTYDNRQITCVDMRKVDLNGDGLRVFDLETEQSIRYQN